MALQYRFMMYGPEELWTMVEPADGSAPADLGVLLTAAAKTINEIGEDLKKHSTAVEWDGEGGDAFRSWIRKAALATLGLGDYSEAAGKSMATAADTLHEVKPQLERLKRSGASARSVLDADGAKESEVTSAQKQYDNDRAEAALLMIKLAQSYSASTERINGLEAPVFPEMPERFVPTDVRDDREERNPAPSESGTAAAVGSAGVAAVGAVALREAARSADLASGGSGPVSPARPNPELPVGGGPSTSLDRAVLPTATPPATSPTTPPSHLPTAISGPGTPPPTPQPQMFTSMGRPGQQSGIRGPMGTPVANGTPGTSGPTPPRAPGRGVPGVTGPGLPGGTGSQASVRTPGTAQPGRPSNGISGGRPLPPQAGRTGSAVPRGTVVGGTPAQQEPGARTGAGAPTAPRAGGSAGGRAAPITGRTGPSAAGGTPMAAHPDGVAGGQPRQAKPTRGAPSGSAQAGSGSAGKAPVTAGHTSPAAVPLVPSRKDGARSDRDEPPPRHPQLPDDDQA
ncbi:hypothetical protein ACFW9D_07955 [Streptomyces sp. NPDC059524]|uniref:hypothetical protein n=1 Tax=Streptomyces sp. NPDC059524 TaxID=3346856 RepID=UPI00367E12E6